MEIISVKTSRKRWLLYLRYKLYNVCSQDIKTNQSLTPQENYKIIFMLRRRIERCLQARQTVYQMYNDDDAGHLEAIEYTKKQLDTTTHLLNDICKQLKEQSNALENNQPTVAAEALPSISLTKSQKKKKKSKQRLTPSDTTLEAESERDWQVLEEENENRIRCCEASFDQINTLLHDMSGTEPLIHMINANATNQKCLVFIYESILLAALEDKTVDTRTLTATFTSVCLESSTIRALNAAYTPSTKSLKSAIHRLLEHEIITKNQSLEIIHQMLEEGGSQNYIGSPLGELTIYIFRNCYQIGGEYTTKSTAHIIRNAVHCVGLMLTERYRAEITESKRAYIRLVAKLGAVEVYQIRETLHHLYKQTGASDAFHISWHLLDRVPRFLISIQSIQRSLLDEEGPFTVTVRVNK